MTSLRGITWLVAAYAPALAIACTTPAPATDDETDSGSAGASGAAAGAAGKTGGAAGAAGSVAGTGGSSAGSAGAAAGAGGSASGAGGTPAAGGGGATAGTTGTSGQAGAAGQTAGAGGAVSAGAGGAVSAGTGGSTMAGAGGVASGAGGAMSAGAAGMAGTSGAGGDAGAGGATAGDTCADPSVIPAVPFVVEASTIGYANDYGVDAGMCTGVATSQGHASPDTVYRFSPMESGTYEVLVEPHKIPTLYDPLVYVATTCPPTKVSCLAASDEVPLPSTGGKELITLMLTAGETYYVFVDGTYDKNASAEGTQGSYKLSVTKKP